MSRAAQPSARRALLNNLGHVDPYFRASEVGVTTVGGLAGEDLAADFTAILMDPAHGTHRLITVFEALTVGRPVLSLRPLLRTLPLDATRPEWQRSRAVEAYLNGAENPLHLRRELFDALATEPASAAREAIRAQLASGFAAGALTVADVRSVLADYRCSGSDNVMGRIYSLQKRLETEPMPQLFDDPIATWLPASTTVIETMVSKLAICSITLWPKQYEAPSDCLRLHYGDGIRMFAENPGPS